MKKLLLWIVHAYSHYISPLLPPHCRFYPSCSHYTHRAIAEHGLITGMRLSVCRVLKCHPWHAGGEDQVPARNKSPSQC